MREGKEGSVRERRWERYREGGEGGRDRERGVGGGRKLWRERGRKGV